LFGEGESGLFELVVVVVVVVGLDRCFQVFPPPLREAEECAGDEDQRQGVGANDASNLGGKVSRVSKGVGSSGRAKFWWWRRAPSDVQRIVRVTGVDRRRRGLC
jgi:hypothetical protein